MPGGSWGNAEIKKPLDHRHQIMQWYDAVCAQQRKHASRPEGEIQDLPLTGLMSAYYGLAYNLYLLQHNAELQAYLIRRLKLPDCRDGALDRAVAVLDETHHIDDDIPSWMGDKLNPSEHDWRNPTMSPRVFTALLAALVVSSALLAEEPKTMVLEGDLSAIYASGDFLVWTPKPNEKRGGAVGMSMSAATSASTSKSPREDPPAFESTVDVVAKAPLAADGTFRIEVPVEQPRVVYFHVSNAIGHEGQRYGAVKGQNFVIEPGNLRITMNESARFVIHGGEYNDAVFNSWKTSDEYLEAVAENGRLWTPVEGETEEQTRARVDLASAAQSHYLGIETNTRAEVSTTHPDPLVRRLVIETAWLGGPWILDALRGLGEMTPEDPWVLERLANIEAAEAKRAKGRLIATGTDIVDFTAESLDGDSVRLADVRADSEIVLVEFWASWCGPCRTEIPHMKQAYEEHQPNGFEIVSFTIDNDRENWELASEEEDLPWLNLGMGEEAEAPTAYSVTGVPRNYLVDSKSGEILATDLRRHELDVKLDELFQ